MKLIDYQPPKAERRTDAPFTFPNQRSSLAAGIQRTNRDAGRCARPLPAWRTTFSRPSMPLHWVPAHRERQTVVTGTAATFSKARKAPNRTAQSSASRFVPKPRLVAGPGLISRAGLIAAICVSWTIAVVAGVFLVGGLT